MGVQIIILTLLPKLSLSDRHTARGCQKTLSFLRSAFYLAASKPPHFDTWLPVCVSVFAHIAWDVLLRAETCLVRPVSQDSE